ncbi:hypothetical protein SEMRO_986_G228160.1 [Seminavis robusta]|uniref:Uncharacterized protein n=1 Tax=Seminavis robusta TaxID=568900 RepID=A0A9N8EGY3_9STRA|nr:hypothetical protein SEMRO_986_G228160.1 [Seminavis robusta]|eukprot:Sro986_g228160.1 n/a (259) ;mRNA; r:33361-34137
MQRCRPAKVTPKGGVPVGLKREVTESTHGEDNDEEHEKGESKSVSDSATESESYEESEERVGRNTHRSRSKSDPRDGNLARSPAGPGRTKLVISREPMEDCHMRENGMVKEGLLNFLAAVRHKKTGDEVMGALLVDHAAHLREQQGKEDERMARRLERETNNRVERLVTNGYLREEAEQVVARWRARVEVDRFRVDRDRRMHEFQMKLAGIKANLLDRPTGKEDGDMKSPPGGSISPGGTGVLSSHLKGSPWPPSRLH